MRPPFLLWVLQGIWLGTMTSLAAGQPTEPPPTVLTRIEQIRQLSSEAAQRHPPARIEGVVTHIDPDNPLLYFIVIQDESGGITVSPRGNQACPRVGDRVRATGTVEPGFGLPFVNRATLEPLGLGTLPEPVRRPLADFYSGEEEGNWVELEGSVRHVGLVLNRTEIEILSEGRRASLLVRPNPQGQQAYDGLIDARIRVAGVFVVQKDSNQRVMRVHLLVNTPGDLVIEQPGPRDLFETPGRSIATINAGEIPSDRRVRIRGQVVEHAPGGLLRIQDETGDILVRSRQPATLHLKDFADAAGFPIRSNAPVHLDDAVLRLLGQPRAEAKDRAGDSTSSEPIGLQPVLTEVRSAQNLGVQAADGLPIRIRGVVTFVEPGGNQFYVQDATAGIFSERNPEPSLELKAGQLVQIDGFSGMGPFAPMLKAETIALLGTGSLPGAKILQPEIMSTGREHGQWLEASGIVRSYARQGDRLTLNLALGNYRISASIPDLVDADWENNLVDAEVKIRGVGRVISNAKRQAIGMSLCSPGVEYIDLIQRPPSDPFSIAAQPLDSLFQFASAKSDGRRIKVAGVLTGFRPGEFLVVQTGAEGLFVQTSQTNRVEVGERLEVLGFPAQNKQRLLLEDAVFRSLGQSEAAVEPARLTAAQVMQEAPHAALITLRARLLDQTGAAEETGLLLQAGEAIFSAEWQNSKSASGAEAFRAGSMLEVTGICQIEFKEDGHPRAFSLLMRSPADLMLLASPPWWTTWHAKAALGILAFSSVAAIGWVYLLRTQVRRQTEFIRQRLAKESALERNLQEAQKLESLGLLAGGVAHDFNNLLTVILGNAGLARSELPADTSAAEYLDEIEKTSWQATELCNQMLAYSGRGQFTVEPVNLSGLVEEMRQLLQVSVFKKIALHFDLAGDLAPVEADKAQIRQVVLNLVLNASDAIGDKVGSISVTTGHAELTEEEINEDFVGQLPSPGSYNYLEVADSGSGMSPEVKARIFQPFFTTKFTGRGLGLAAALGIVRGHHGALKVTSELGQGSTFSLLVPCLNQGSAALVPEERPLERWRGSGTVLLVDDEVAVRKVVSRTLESFGFRVLHAHDGLAAVELFRARVHEIALVMLDLTMPRMNGQEALAQIRQVRPELPVILMSGYSEKEVFPGTGDPEGAVFMHKPFSQEELRQRIQLILEKGAGRPAKAGL